MDGQNSTFCDHIVVSSEHAVRQIASSTAISWYKFLPANASKWQLMCFFQSKQYLQTHTVPNAHPTDIFALATTPTQLLTVSGSSSIKVYNTRAQAIHADTADDDNAYPLVQTLEKVHPLGCHHICAALGGTVAASVGFGGEVKVWEIESEGGLWHARGTVVGETDRADLIHTWNSLADLLHYVGEKGAGEHWAVALNEDGRYLAATTHDGRINVYDTSTISSTATEIPTTKIASYTTKGSFGMALDISPSGNMTASGHQNGTVYIFNNTTQRLTHSLTGLIKAVRSVKFSPANTYLAAAGDARIVALYDTTSGEQVANFTGHTSWVMTLDWNWSGEYLLSGAYDGKAKIWSLERRECVATQTEGEKCLWAVKWLYKAASVRSESFVTGAAGGMLAFYREAAGI